ncbi:MAG: hydroxyethylthiazole kinase [Eggerthellaceae bacterium]|nr:hydroxyethylthiazole kinase [Eggerthellaceae bacterium]
MDITNIGASLDRVRTTHPLVHNITNYVTVNDCANALLAIDASPIMSDEPLDVGDIQTICGGLVINIGTLNERTIQGMHAGAKTAAELGHPIVLDPVGAGASKLRTQTAAELLDAYPVAIVRGNISEIKALASGAASTRGVDVCPDDIVTDENLAASAAFARDFAAQTGAVVAITGPIDIVADATRSFAVRNGSKLQGRITGAGCMLSCITGAFAVANDDKLLAALGAVCTTGVAGNLAEERMGELDGNLSFRTYLIDALYKLDGEMLASRALVEDVR